MRRVVPAEKGDLFDVLYSGALFRVQTRTIGSDAADTRGRQETTRGRMARQIHGRARGPTDRRARSLSDLWIASDCGLLFAYLSS
jgi:hypothetical protein